MTVAGVAAVSVIAGQEQSRQQDRLQRTPQTRAVHMEARDQTAAPRDTVTLSGSGLPQTSDAVSFTRYLQPENQQAIAAYQAIQAGSRSEHSPEAVEDGILTDQPVPPERAAQTSVDIRG